MKRLLPVLVAIVVVLACSTAWARWPYLRPAVVYRPVAPVVTYYAPAVPVLPAPVVTSAPVVVPTPILTPGALVYPGAVVYPVPAVVRARVYYRPVRPIYGVFVP